MEQYAYITPILASVFYLVAGGRLLGLHRRTGERPALLLGVSFAIWGLYYLAYNTPSLLRLDPWSPAIEWMVDWVYTLGAFPYIFFIRTVFRPEGAWPAMLVVNCSTLLLVGTAMGGIDGHAVFSLDNPWFLVQWLGYTTPCVWLCCEATLSRHGARKRARLGLVPPLVVNRYLLLAFLGGFQSLACLADLSFARDLTYSQTVSTASNVMVGASEIASVVVLWLAFFPPPFYANWITQRAATVLEPVEV
jgi:hypothetical protein